MWVFTKQGFISIVEHRDNADDLLVRSRASEDIEALFPSASIEFDPSADYVWRAVVPRLEVMAVVSDCVADVDYDSHAKENMTDNGRDTLRYSAYLKVWDAMYNFQETLRRRASAR